MLNCQFFERWQIVEVYVDLSFANGDVFYEQFNDFATTFQWHAWPTGVKVSGLGHDMVARKVVDFQEVHLGFDPRYLLLDLVLPCVEGLVNSLELGQG